MNRDGHKNVTFFVGPEVEHTPAFSKKTLFVVDYQPTETVEKYAKEHKVQHIFFGANHSFDATHNTAHFSKTWNDQITYFLEKGYWVTLDYQAHQHNTVRSMLGDNVWQSRLFVPLLGVRIPDVETSSPNLTVKIDDTDFNATNRGVWCMSSREVTDSNRFTDWNEYSSDFVIQQEGERKIVSVDVGNMTATEAVKIIEEIKNDPSLGLDTESTSQLKPELDEMVSKITPENVHKALLDTPDKAAEAYAEGTTKDPLASKPAVKKATKK